MSGFLESKPIQTWQQQYQQGFSHTKSLLSFLEIAESQVELIQGQQFPLRVPLAFARRMQKGNPRDPLLLQALPLQKELLAQPGYHVDPVGEQNDKVNPIPGLLHKYHGRVLLTLTSACAIHCRYCFRRHFPYEENNPGRKGWDKAIEYIQQHAQITEVILSGGDPLSVSDNLLLQFMTRLEKISHVKYLRIHTRLPVMIPDRVTHELLEMLQLTRFRVTVVLHCNHANEIDQEVEQALARLKQAHVTLLNQSVLLKDVNDSVEALLALSYRLFDNAVLPYYLHLLDKVSGASHFEVSQQQAVSIARQLIDRLPGYLVPKLVYEARGYQSKVTVDLHM